MTNRQKKNSPDFSGMATAYEVLCTDGRTIGTNAFAHQDGVQVPLVWRHQHDSITNVLGHGVLRSTQKGMMLDGYFSDTEGGRHGLTLVKDRSIRHMSVWANGVVETAARVTGGNIREVSLVLAGKNPGATINNVMAHSEDGFEDELITDQVIIHGADEIVVVEDPPEPIHDGGELSHEDGSQTLSDVLNTFSEEQMTLVSHVLAAALTGETNTGPKKTAVAHSDTSVKMEAIYKSLTATQKDVLHLLVGEIIEGENTDMEHSDDRRNIFEEGSGTQAMDVLSHGELNAALSAGLAHGKGFLSHSIMSYVGEGEQSDVILQHGIDNIEILFPDAKDVAGGSPYVVKDDQTWVDYVMRKTTHSPFSRTKNRYGVITEEDARARGYITGAQKWNQTFPVFTRSTNPTTIYAKSDLDRDDVIDITDFDVLVWMKGLSRIKLNEEIARAVLLGDGRDAAHADKIPETNIRPVWTDDAIYTHTVELTALDVSADTSLRAASTINMIDEIAAARVNYKGSGKPTLFITIELLARMLLVRDELNRRLYSTTAQLAAELRVGDIVEVLPMTGMVDELGQPLLAIMVNLKDYTLGTDKGGNVTFFSDFDIDFNKMKYLLETRMSGALVIPKSAVVFIEDTVA